MLHAYPALGLMQVVSFSAYRIHYIFQSCQQDLQDSISKDINSMLYPLTLFLFLAADQNILSTIQKLQIRIISVEIFTFFVCYLLSTRHIIDATDGFIGRFLLARQVKQIFLPISWL